MGVASFTKTLRPTEVKYGFIGFDAWQRGILGQSFTIWYTGEVYEGKLTKAHRFVCRRLIHDISAAVGMSLHFKKRQDGVFLLTVLS